MNDLANLPLKGEAIKINGLVRESLYRAANGEPDPTPIGGTIDAARAYLIGEDVTESTIPRKLWPSG
jgi:hypothetical protein